MRLHPPSRSSLITIVSVAALLAVAGSGTTAVAGARPARTRLAGTWAGKYSGAFTGTFTLHWTQSGTKLHGSIALSKPHGTYGISGSVHGTSISFGAVGAGATYTGSVSGTSMSGRYRSPAGGGSWSAHKRS